MRLARLDNLFVLHESPYQKRHIPGDAGFEWHPPKERCLKKRCPMCNAGVFAKWWTDDALRALKLVEYADDSCREILQKIKEESGEALAASWADDSDLEIPAPSGQSYMPYQRAGIAYAAVRNGVLFGDEMGLGKTIQAIGVININPWAKTILIVCPASLKVNWRNELRKWLIRPLDITIVDSNSIKRRSNIWIVNYDILHKYESAFVKMQWDIVIADEAHYVKNSSARRSKAFYKIPGKKRLCLTGTPLMNRVEDVYPILKYLDPESWPSAAAFEKRYCKSEKIQWRDRKTGELVTRFKYSGGNNLDELQVKMRSTVMVRRKKSDVLKELPPKRRQVLELPNDGFSLPDDLSAAAAELVRLTAAASSIYDDHSAMAELKEWQHRNIDAIARIRRMTGEAKLPYVLSHLKTIVDSGGKFIVFAHHKSVIRAIVDSLESAEVKTVSITGETPQLLRQENVDKFQNDPDVKVFVGNIQAAGVGLTLTASAHIVFAEVDWVPANLQQAEDRAHRIGQDESVFIQYLVLEGSLDAYMCAKVLEKIVLSEKALDKLSVA